MGFVSAAVVTSVCLQLYYQFSCSVYWIYQVMDDRLFASRDFDENFLDVLVIARVVLTPVSVILLVAKPWWGKMFTGSLLLFYGLGGMAMPLIALDGHPSAWWPNLRSAGAGPVISLVFLVLGITLLMHKQVIRAVAVDAPGTPPGTPPPA
jgi:succinate dehydrogenase hydrophobic anchor subunit